MRPYVQFSLEVLAIAALLVASIALFTSDAHAPPTADQRSVTTTRTETTGSTTTTTLPASGVQTIPVTATFTLPILAFHHIGPAPTGLSSAAQDWYISASRFEEILAFIHNKGYTTLTSSELVNWLENNKLPARTVLLTFDDGAKDFITTAWPLLQKYNLAATMHVQSHVRSKAWLSDDDIRILAQDPRIEIGSHSKYHEYLTRVSAQDAKEEIEGSKQRLEEIIGEPVLSFAYPFGLYDEQVIRLTKQAGYALAYTIDWSAQQQRDGLFALSRRIVTEYTPVEDFLRSIYN